MNIEIKRSNNQNERIGTIWLSMEEEKLQEGLTLRIYLTSEKEQYILENEIDIKQCQSI